MPEILTESFCERCGTRYTFESAAPKGARLKGLKTMSRGIKNFVMSDDASIDEAMAAARNETDREATSQQLDAFHKTFNFCMSCRQYTCSNCWNDVDGRCLSCAPHVGHDILVSPFPNVEPSGALPFGLTSPLADDHNGHDWPEATAEPMAWPTSDLMRDEEQPAISSESFESFESALAAREAETVDDEAFEEIDPLARLAALDASPVRDIEIKAIPAEPEPEPVVETWQPAAIEAEEAFVEPPAADWPAELEPAAEVAAEPEATLEDEPEIPEEFDDRAAAAAAQTSDLFRRFRPGQNLDEAIAAYELAQAAADALADTPDVAPAAEPTPVQPAARPAAAPHVPPAREPEPIAAIGPIVEPGTQDWDRVAATAEPEPAPFAPEPEPFAPEPEPIAAARPHDVVPQPTWQIIAPETPPEPEWPAQPQWPAQPEWPAQREPTDGLAFLGRPAQPSGGIDALWVESAREVTSAAGVEAATPAVAAAIRPVGGVQPCVSCGLSLSANARFCRRCGSRQG